MQRSGLDQFVEAVYSIEQVQRFKPRWDVYPHVASASGVDPSEIALVATHARQIHGAAAAGLRTGFVVRRQSYPSIMFSPEVEGQTLLDVVNAFMEMADQI